MDLANLLIGIGSLFVGLFVGAAGVLFARKNAQNSAKRAEIERQAYLDSRPCQLNVVARIVAVDESPVGGVSLRLEVRNDGLGRAFNIGCEARSTFLWDFDYQRTARNAQTLSLMRRDPGSARSRISYAPFGFDERLDIPPHLRDVGLKFLEPEQRHSIEDLFLVPWAYLGHPSEHELKPLEEVLGPEITGEELKTVAETVVPGRPEDELGAIFQKCRPGEDFSERLSPHSAQYQRNETLPPGLLLYGTFEEWYGDRGKAFLFGAGNGLQLTLSFSHCEGEETKFFALPCPLLIFHPETGVEIPLEETDAKGVILHDSQTVRVY